MTTFKRLTPPQRELAAVLRARGVVILTPENARPLHALKRRGLARFGLDVHGRRVAFLRLTAAQKRANAREDRATIAALAAYDALPLEGGGLPAGKGRGRKLTHGEDGRRVWPEFYGSFSPEGGV
jgi:hypothetical protein